MTQKKLSLGLAICSLAFCFVSFVFAAVCSVLFLSPSTHAYSLTVSADDVYVEITSGETSVKKADIEVVTNCRAGYNFSISTTTNPSLYLNGNSSNTATFTAVNGTNALSNSNNTNKWGYYYNSNQSTVPTDSSTFLPLSTTQTTLRTPSQTASPSSDIDDDFSIYYGVNAGASVAPGLYYMANSGKINYYATADTSCENYTVNFNPNGGTGTMTSQNIQVSTPTKLKANEFTAPTIGSSYQNASGTTINGTAGKLWTFWGWNTNAAGTGDWYKDKESVLGLASADQTITLYAQWKQATLDDMPVATTGTKTITHSTMQDMSAAICFNSDITTKAALEAANKTGAVTLTDNRDGTTRSYDVSKLADGLCWMTTNLALGSAEEQITLTSDDTDLADGTTFTLYAADTASYTSTTREPRIRLTNNDGNSNNGVYYTWAAAVASTASTSNTLTTSICPKNWDLPTDAQFTTLSSASSYSSSNPTTDLPSQFKIDGGFTDGATFYQTTYSHYWTPRSYSTTRAYGARINSTTITNKSSSGTTSGGNKYYRKNIRCVANMDDASYTITFVNTDGGATQNKTIIINQSTTTQPSTTWSRVGYKLNGWDTNSAGTNVVYTNGQTITPTSDITLYTVWTPIYSIQYNGNGADAGSMDGVTHTNVTENDVFDLFAPNFSKEGYGFAGWSFNPDAQPGGASKIYGPNEAITAPAPVTPGEIRVIFAIWVASAGTMQNWNGCSSMNIGDVTALNDIRDSTNNSVYTVGKLEDGNCWMMENLRLNTSGSDDSTKAQGFGGVFTGLADPETTFSYSTTANTLNGNTLYSTSIITGNSLGYRFPRYNNINTSARSSSPSATDNRATATSAHTTSLTAAIYSYGNYYTWAAALANTGDYTSATATIDGKTSETANTSICPAGWILPYGRDTGNGLADGGYYNLGVKLNATSSDEASSRIWREYPNNTVYSGITYSSSIYNRGLTANTWSSTASTTTGAFFYGIAYSALDPGTANLSGTNYKYRGYTVRCVKLPYTPIILNDNSATTASSSTTKVEVGDSALGTITNPQRSYSVSGWTTPSGNNASGAIVNGGTAPGTLNSNYTFNGWYKESAATNLIASNATTPVLQANTDYTDSTGKWNYSGNSVTLYAGWTGQSVILPSITKDGYDCGWTTTSTGATSITYNPGSSFTPSADTTLYGVCVAKTYNITLSVSQGTLGSTSTTVTYGATTLGTITNPTRADSVATYSFSGFTLLSSATGASVSSTDTVSVTRTVPYTFSGWYESTAGSSALIASNDTTPALQANTTYTNSSSQWTYTTAGTITLYGKWTLGTAVIVPAILPTITLAGHECGWSPSNTATTISYASGGTIGFTNNMVPNRPLYGVCVATGYTVNFNANGGTGTMDNQIITGDVSTKLDANKFTAPAIGSSYQNANNTTINGSAGKLWTFWGWNTNAAGTGDWYKDRESVLNLAQVGGSITLYAQWKQPTLADLTTTTPGANKTIDHNTMQDMSPAACYNSEKFTAIGTPYGQATLTDNRDGTTRTYTVAKLPDGLCWMTQNLNLGASTAITLTPDDTDITEDFTLPASDPNDFSTGNGQANVDKARVLNNMTVPDYTVNGTTYSGKINAYYSYAAATADIDTYSKTAGGVTTTSICAKNWDLPIPKQINYLKTVGSVSTYNNTAASYIGKNAGNEPYYFIYGGYRKAAGNEVNTTNFNNPITYGYLWTADSINSYQARGNYISSGGIYSASTGVSYNKYFGLSIRCVASSGKATVHYDKNDVNATGTMADQTNIEINTGIISSNAFTLTGYQFKNWNTAPDGSGTSVAANAVLSSLGLYDGQEITLYAQWDPVYKITYVNNCATFNTGCTTSTSNGTSNQNIILANNPSTGSETGTLNATNAWTQTNYKIASWNTAADGSSTSYVPSSTFTVPAGSVPGDGITLYAQWTPSYTIVFDGNGADNEMTGMRNSSEYSVKFTNVSGGDEIELLAPNYYKTGYGFAGWSFDSSATPGGSATIYGPNETITAPAPSTPGETKKLYAIWVASAGTMQNWSGCASMNIGDVTALNDIRDSTGNNVYTVGKLADGNCWMMENLRLNNNTTTPNWGNDNLSQGFGGVFHGLAASESDFPSTATANTLYSTNGSTAYTISGDNQQRRFPRYNNDNTASLQNNPSYTRNYTNATSPTNTPSYPNYQTKNVYSYGNYYNWPAALANTEDIVRQFDSENTGTSICPAGWRLPTGGRYINGTNDYYELTTGISGLQPDNDNGGYGAWNNSTNVKVVLNALKHFPNNYVLSGSWAARGDRGSYWSTSLFESSGNNGSTAYSLNYSSTGVGPASNGGTNTATNGFSVRCIAKSTLTISDLTYMQDFASLSTNDKISLFNSMVTDEQYQLTDARDGRMYYISKLQDGHIWMTQNLDLDLGVNTLTHNSTTLYHDDTDLGWGSDTATTSWTPANATQHVTYDTDMKGTFSSIGSGATYNSIPGSLDVGNWYYAGYDGTTLLASTTINYLTSNNRIKINGVITVNNGNGINYFSTAPFATNGEHGHLGNYYNWSAVIASNDTSSYTTQTNSNIASNPQNSICPAGWRLPIVVSGGQTDMPDSDNEYLRLNRLYNNGLTNDDAGVENSPLYFTRNGVVYGDSLSDSGYSGYYLSSTIYNGSYFYGLDFFATQITNTSLLRNGGRAVRCVAR